MRFKRERIDTQNDWNQVLISISFLLVEATTPAPAHSEEKPVARSGSPLGRRITQIFRGFSSKKKVPTVSSTEEAAKKEENVAATTETAEEPAAATAAATEEEHVAAPVEEHEEKNVAPVIAPAQTPVVQATV